MIIYCAPRQREQATHIETDSLKQTDSKTLPVDVFLIDRIDYIKLTVNVSESIFLRNAIRSYTHERNDLFYQLCCCEIWAKFIYIKSLGTISLSSCWILLKMTKK